MTDPLTDPHAIVLAILAAEKAALLAQHKRRARRQTNPDGTYTPHGERRHQASMDRWARRYDALHGALESAEDC